MSLKRLPAPTKRFSHTHIDLVGPYDAANAKACTRVLVREWLTRWDVPDIITSDRGSQFVSDPWLEVCSLIDIARQ